MRGPIIAEEMQQANKQVRMLEDEIKTAGAWGFSGRLHDPDTATVVRVSEDEILTTDGPFTDWKRHLGGSSRPTTSTSRSRGFGPMPLALFGGP